MRTYRDLCRAVKAAGIPFYRVCRDADDTAPVPVPFAFIVPGETSDVVAGGGNYAKATEYTVELYERGSSLELEERLEAALEGEGFPYVRRCVPLEDGVVEMAYELVVLGR